MRQYFTKKIEYAHIMTPQEVSNYFGFLNGKHQEKIVFTQNWYNQNKEWVKAKYYQLEQKYIMERVEQERKQNRKCTWVWINPAWIDEIGTSKSIDRRFSQKELLILMERDGLIGLRKKHNTGSPTLKRVDTYNRVNAIAKEEEKAVSNFLKNHFKVLEQVGIRYKIEGEKEKKCFPDIIASDEKYVVVVDVKGGTGEYGDKKIFMYCQLVSFMMQKRNDKRTVLPSYIVAKREDWDNGEYAGQCQNTVWFDDLKNLHNKEQILNKISVSRFNRYTNY